jgi:hypothetical protein
MVDPCGCARFLQEPLHELRPLRVLAAQDFDRDLATELGIARCVDFSEAASTEHAADFVLADAGDRFQRR